MTKPKSEIVNKLEPVHRDRGSTGLDVLEIEIVDAETTHRCDPNGAALIGITRTLPVDKPAFPSVLTNEPGYLYRSSDFEVALSGPELMRLLRRELEPKEALALLARFGQVYELHDDFYDPETGEAMQPMSERVPDMVIQKAGKPGAKKLG